MGVRRVQPWQRMVIFRWGRTGPALVREPGLRFTVPIMDRGVLVNWRIVDALLSQTNTGIRLTDVKRL
jgi:regulator of protease activity HflC (stomatin/prohibitin superfamily)